MSAARMSPPPKSKGSCSPTRQCGWSRWSRRRTATLAMCRLHSSKSDRCQARRFARWRYASRSKTSWRGPSSSRTTGLRQDEGWLCCYFFLAHSASSSRSFMMGSLVAFPNSSMFMLPLSTRVMAYLHTSLFDPLLNCRLIAASPVFWTDA